MKPWHINRPLLGLALLALGILGVRSGRAAGQLGLDSVVANPGRRASVPLTLEADTAAVAFQVDVVANPPVIEFRAPVTGGLAGSHFVEGAETGRGVYRIIVYSLFNQPLQQGLVLNLDCTVNPAFEGETVALAMTNAIVASVAGTAVAGVQTSGGLIRLGPPAALRITSASVGAGVLRLRVSGLSSGRVTLEQTATFGSWTVAETLDVSGSEALFALPMQPADRTRFFRVRAE